MSDSGGVSGYKGYEYQITASVWLVLNLFLEQNICKTLIVEPASQEDVEALLTGVNPENAINDLMFNTIQVQIKLLSNSHWTPSAIKNILKPESKKNPRKTYLVVFALSSI